MSYTGASFFSIAHICFGTFWFCWYLHWSMFALFRYLLFRILNIPRMNCSSWTWIWMPMVYDTWWHIAQNYSLLFDLTENPNHFLHGRFLRHYFEGETAMFPVGIHLCAFDLTRLSSLCLLHSRFSICAAAHDRPSEHERPDLLLLSEKTPPLTGK